MWTELFTNANRSWPDDQGEKRDFLTVWSMNLWWSRVFRIVSLLTNHRVADRWEFDRGFSMFWRRLIVANPSLIIRNTHPGPIYHYIVASHSNVKKNRLRERCLINFLSYFRSTITWTTIGFIYPRMNLAQTNQIRGTKINFGRRFCTLHTFFWFNSIVPVGEIARNSFLGPQWIF